nr:DIM1 family protein [Cryptomonas paramecium]
MKYLKSEYSLDQFILDEECKIICVFFNSNYQNYFYKLNHNDFPKKTKNITYLSIDTKISKSFNQMYEISKTFGKIYFYKNKRILLNQLKYQECFEK